MQFQNYSFDYIITQLITFHWFHSTPPSQNITITFVSTHAPWKHRELLYMHGRYCDILPSWFMHTSQNKQYEHTTTTQTQCLTACCQVLSQEEYAKKNVFTNISYDSHQLGVTYLHIFLWHCQMSSGLRCSTRTWIFIVCYILAMPQSHILKSCI